MSKRPHPKKEWEALLKRCESAGWRVTRKQGYYIVWCPCGDHHKSVPLTPSDPNKLRNTTNWFERQPCWKDGE